MIDECIEKMWYVYICVYIHIYERLLLIHKKWYLAICDMDEPKGYYAQWNKSEKDKYDMIFLICGILKNEARE